MSHSLETCITKVNINNLILEVSLNANSKRDGHVKIIKVVRCFSHFEKHSKILDEQSWNCDSHLPTLHLAEWVLGIFKQDSCGYQSNY